MIGIAHIKQSQSLHVSKKEHLDKKIKCIELSFNHQITECEQIEMHVFNTKNKEGHCCKKFLTLKIRSTKTEQNEHRFE